MLIILVFPGHWCYNLVNSLTSGPICEKGLVFLRERSSTMIDSLNKIRQEAMADIGSLNSLKDLEGIRIKYMGKKGKLTLILREMGKLSKDDRPIIGQLD